MGALPNVFIQSTLSTGSYLNNQLVIHQLIPQQSNLHIQPGNVLKHLSLFSLQSIHQTFLYLILTTSSVKLGLSLGS